MKIWITGCAGFLGGRLAQRFSLLGHQVVGLSRRACSFEGHAVSLDLAVDAAREQLQTLGDEFGTPEVVVHAASRQPGERGELHDYLKSNVMATANLLAALKHFPPRLVIYTSTHSVYQRPETNPVKETSAANGSLPYGATKRWAEQIIEAFQEQAQVIILRLPSLYGAGQADSFIDGLAQVAMRGEPIELFARGRLVRDALHVDDVIEAIVNCATRTPQARASYLNLGCGRAITTREYAEALVAALESRSAIVPVDRPASHFDFYADIAEARRRIDFRPTDLPDAMRKYADELRARP
jgi:nucleoside-diphosphate-sugar epimerase